MLRLPNIHFDRISFLLGFLAATLFWWFIARARPLLPILGEQIRRSIQAFRQRNLAGAEEYLRRETVRRAQRSHAAAALFALDEVLIEPHLMAPPAFQEPDEPPLSIPIAAQVLPYLPDWPELTANLGAPTLSLAQALENGCHIAVVGQPGSGKTVALAHLASLLAQRDPSAGKLQGVLPLLLHAMDLDPSLSEGQDPRQNLIKAVASQGNIVSQPQVTRFLKTTFAQPGRKPVLILDGLDELAPEPLSAVSRYLEALLAVQPDLQIVTSASAQYVDGLTRIGFIPLGMAAWSLQQRAAFTQRWGRLWTEQLLPDVRKHFNVLDTDPRLIERWLLSEVSCKSPFEWTLKVWAAYAGDLNGAGMSHLLDTYIARILPEATFHPALQEAAHQYIQYNTSGMDYDALEKLLTAFQPDQPLSVASDDASPIAEAVTETPKRKKRRLTKEVMTTQGERILDGLVRGGLLLDHTGSRLRFSSPVVLGYLASARLTNEETEAVVHDLKWDAGIQSLRFSAVCGGAGPWLAQILQNQTPPLFNRLLIAARWLSDAPPQAEWRTYLLRQMAALLQQETVPAGVRARFTAAFVTAREPSALKLFKQLLLSRSVVVRQNAVMGCAALGGPALADDFLAMLADSDAQVRKTACLALASLPGENALRTVVDILMQGDEEIRQTAAEALAQRPGEGQQVLQEAVAVDDLLARHAAVFGLMQVREDWARQLLEKVAVEDAQWIVRNAAAQALESFQQSNPFVPRPLPAPAESAWLLAFASKLGQGVRPDQPATSILLTALRSGTLEEQIGALSYLRTQADEGVIGVIYHVLYSNQAELQQQALTALWWILLSGVKIPNPTQFGLG